MKQVLVKLIDALLLRSCDDLLSRGTEIAIGTEGAVEADFWGELSVRNSVGRFLHSQFRRFQLIVGSRGVHRRVVFKVVEHKAVGAFPPSLPGRKRVQGKL